MDANITVLEIRKREREHDYPGYRTKAYRSSTGTYWPSRWVSLRRGSRDAKSGKSVIYVDVKGETFWENFACRTSRPASLWKKPIIEAFSKKYFGANAVDLTGMHWYAKAGCSMCPCSPGFILPHHRGVDFWVSLTSDVLSEDAAEVAHRLDAVRNDPTLAPFVTTS